MSETTQLASNNYKEKTATAVSFVGGRRHHSESSSPYPLPSDQDEISRLNMQHRLFQEVMKKKYHAPLNNPKQVIDIATGTGIWMTEVAPEFPECKFTGVDIVQLQPDAALPPNCTFKFANIFEGLPYPDGYFDYVRHSMLVAAIPKEKWQPYINECARICASGGWVEMTELSCIIKDGGPARSKSHKLVIDSFNACGVNLEAVEILDDYMRKAGLVDISVQKFKLPLGDWGGNAGRLFAKNIQEAYATLIPLYASTSGISRKELEQLAEQVEVETKDYNAYEYLYVYTGRKP